MEIKERACFIPILRIIEMIPNNIWEEKPYKKGYVEKLIGCLEKEGYVVDAKLVNEKLRIINGENVAMATMDEEYGD